MVTKEVWAAVMPDDPGDMERFLCIGCLEERLGRRLTSLDFTDAPVNLWTGTDRFIDRRTTISSTNHRT